MGLGSVQIILMRRIVPSVLQTPSGAVLGISVYPKPTFAITKKTAAMAVTREAAGNPGFPWFAKPQSSVAPQVTACLLSALVMASMTVLMAAMRVSFASRRVHQSTPVDQTKSACQPQEAPPVFASKGFLWQLLASVRTSMSVPVSSLVPSSAPTRRAHSSVAAKKVMRLKTATVDLLG